MSLPKDLFVFQPNQGDYLAFLGRISPEKRVDRAIEIAKRVSMPLKIAAKIDRADRRYFKRDIEPLLTQSHVEWVGEISDQEKNEFLGNAYALLFPIDWPEPFGLVMIESMACGTPVIAYDCGSVPEVMEDGVTGFIVRDLEDAVKGVNEIRNLSRSRCREVFERRFAADRMASDYVDVYHRLLDNDVKATDLSTSPDALVSA
jgi:glycosyltransferase involved in cell wall biosynthesis